MNAHLERIQHGYTTGVRRIVADVVKSLRRIPLSANQVTGIGFSLNVVAAVLIYEHQWIAAGMAFLLGSVLDVFDGAIARSKGQDGPRGAFIDSTFDRIAEAAVLDGHRPRLRPGRPGARARCSSSSPSSARS